MILEKLKSEMINAMKSGDKSRKNVISAIIAQIKNVAIDKNCRDNITEDIVNEVLLKYKKMTQEMIETCPADRTETLEEYKKQMAVVVEFAPTLITDENKIRTSILDIVNNKIDLTKSNKGKIMKIVTPVFKGKVDLKIANSVLENILV